MENEVIGVLLHRRSVRQYTDEIVERGLLDEVLKAGTYAPTGGGRQQIKIVAVQAEEDVAQIKKLNAAVTNRGGDPYYGAGTIVLILAYPENHNADLDGAAVCTNMLNAADALGLGACWINRSREVFASEDGKALLRKWGLRDDLVGVASFALGHIAVEYPVPAPRREDYITVIS